MSEFNGTPGPWFTGNDDDCETIYASDNGKQYDEANIVKVAIIMRDDGDYQKMEADARLIAASPELLAELQHSRTVLHDLHYLGDTSGVDVDAALARIDAAIAKALGETTWISGVPSVACAGTTASAVSTSDQTDRSDS